MEKNLKVFEKYRLSQLNFFKTKLKNQNKFHSMILLTNNKNNRII
jgi:hypothetical protein